MKKVPQLKKTSCVGVKPVSDVNVCLGQKILSRGKSENKYWLRCRHSSDVPLQWTRTQNGLFNHSKKPVEKEYCGNPNKSNFKVGRLCLPLAWSKFKSG